MKYLPKASIVWAIPVRYYVGNSPGAWSTFELKIGQWKSLVKYVKENYTLEIEFISSWNSSINERGYVVFYMFPEPVDGYVGFLVNKSDILGS